MHLVVIGVNHTTAPVDVRERLSIPDGDPRGFPIVLRRSERIRETVVLSTCNRTEVYAYTLSRADDEIIMDAMAEYCKLPRSAFESHLYSLAGHKAIEHLFRVASGLDSMVLGEAQILGQVKSAYAAASEAHATGSVLNTLFQRAITVGKRARTETEIGRGAFSIGYAAVQLARSIFDPLKGRTVLIVGAGKMGELAATHLSSAGVTSVLVANRTHERGVALAERFGGRAIEFGEVPTALQTSDIVITSTGADKPIITRDMVSRAAHSRRGRPVFFIDVAVPRDVEPGVGDLGNVFLYNIDDLQAVVAADADDRRAEIEKVHAIIAEEVEQFMEWFRTLDAVPVITALREKLEDIRLAELDKLRGRLPDLSDEQLEAVDQSMRSIVNKICHQPMIQIKEYAAGEDSSFLLDTICEVFGICPADGTDDEKEGSR